MYWDEMKECFLAVSTAEKEGADALVALAEECKARLCEMLDDDGIVLLEEYAACLDLLNRNSNVSHKDDKYDSITNARKSHLEY